MKIILTGILFLIQLPAWCQYTAVMGKRDNSDYALANASGSKDEVFKISKYEKVVEGSPYFYDDWKKATLVADENKMLRGQMIRLDLLANQVQYLDSNGQIFIIAQPLQKIIFERVGDEAEQIFIHGTFLQLKNEKFRNVWFVQSPNANTPLYKQFIKVMTDINPIGSASIQQRIETTEKMFYVSEGELIKVKK